MIVRTDGWAFGEGEEEDAKDVKIGKLRKKEVMDRVGGGAGTHARTHAQEKQMKANLLAQNGVACLSSSANT